MVVVEKIDISGDAHISAATAKALTRSLMQATDIEDVASASLEIASRLSSLGIAGKCDVVLDSTEDGLLVVKLLLEKLPTISVRVGSSISAEAGDVNASLSIRNVSGFYINMSVTLGRGDNLSISISQGTNIQNSLAGSQFDNGKTFSVSFPTKS